MGQPQMSEPDDLKATLDALYRENGQLLDLIYDLADDGQCRLDHHGYCQEHGWMETTECPHARARRVLVENLDEREFEDRIMPQER